MHRNPSARQPSGPSRRYAIGLAVALLGTGLLLAGPAGAAGPVVAERFLIATADPRASAAGLSILERGGSAADAAIAAQLVLGLVEPQSSGLGGGAFLLHHEAASGRIVTLDGRETAPAAAGPDLFLDPAGEPLPFAAAVASGRAVGVPGLPRLLEEAHRRFGRLPWAELFAPAIALAEAGFSVSPRLARAIAQAAETGLADQRAARALFLDDEGRPPPAGAILRNPAYARTLRLLAEGGAAAFYEGPIAREILAAVAEGHGRPGAMSAADLAGYRVVERPAVCTLYRGREVCGMGPPSSGGVAVAQILGLLEPFDLAALGPSLRAVHLLLEASRLAFADRDRFLADPDHEPVPVEGLLDPGYLDARRRLIDPARSLGRAPAGEPPRRQGALPADPAADTEHGTSHLVVVDAQGNALSMTTTIEASMGSRLVAGGFLLNNQLTDFAFLPVRDGRPVANRVAGGKRPRSSMAPTIVREAGRPVLLLGSPGGSRIIGYVVKTLVAALDWGLDPRAAIELGHVLNRNGPSEIEVGGLWTAFAEPLESRGHEVRILPLDSGLQAIAIAPGRLLGAADPRREGSALGR